MEHFEIQPVLASAIPEVAGFLHKQDPGRFENSPVRKPVGEDPRSIERRLKWLLLDNPFATSGSAHGFCIRDIQGGIRGLLLSFPSGFVIGDQRFPGLASGGFYVEPQARTMGFYLFKKYLKSPGYSFFFSTTCNSNSAPLWQALGGSAIPNSELEYILPLRLQALLPALLAGKTSSGVALAMAHLLGRCGNRVMQFSRRRSAGIAIEPCRDWRKLSDLFHRYRSKDSITADRSPEFLEWRYGQNSDTYPSGVYLFRDKRGNEGWFSLGRAMRGRWGHIEGAVLLDAILPPDRIGFREILPEIVQLVAGRFDVLSLRPRPGLDYGECSRWVIRRRLAVAAGFAIPRHGISPLPAPLDLSWADGDSALPISPILRSEMSNRQAGLAQQRLQVS